MEPFIYFDGQGRKQTYYGDGHLGATFSKDRSYLPGFVTDSRYETEPATRTELVRRSRFMKKNSGLLRKLCFDIVEYTIGAGIIPIPAMEDEGKAEAYWDYWVEVNKQADIQGFNTFYDLQARVLANKFWDGDCGRALIAPEGGMPKFQLVRSHLIGNWEVDSNDTSWVDGVKIDKVNRPVKFRILERGERIRLLDPWQFIHSVNREVGDEIRAVPMISHALNDVHDIMDTLALEKKVVKDISTVGRYARNKSGQVETMPSRFRNDSGTIPKTSTLKPGDSIPERKVYGNEIPVLGEGDEIEVLRSDRPSPTFIGFLDYLGKQATAGCRGFPYEFSWKMDGLGSATVRQVMDRVRASVRVLKADEIKDSARAYAYAISVGIQNKDIPPDPQWWRAEWLPTAPDPTIDRSKDGKEIREAIKAGTMTFKQAYALAGEYYKRGLRQKAMEAAYIDALAAEFAVSPDRIHQLTPNSQGTEQTLTITQED